MAFWKSLRSRWRMLVTLLVAASIAGLIGLYFHMRANYDFCELAESRSLPGPAGQTIEMETRFCGLLAGDPGTIVVRLRSIGNDQGTIVLVYSPSISMPEEPDPPWYPQISWLRTEKVSITISRISQLHRQRFAVGDVQIVYQIGKVDYQNAS